MEQDPEPYTGEIPPYKNARLVIFIFLVLGIISVSVGWIYFFQEKTNYFVWTMAIGSAMFIFCALAEWNRRRMIKRFKWNYEERKDHVSNFYQY